MEDQKNNRAEDKDLNKQEPQDVQKQNMASEQKHKKHSSAADIDAIIGSATENVRSRRHTSDWSNTGTNISYEGATAPGGQGSVGTGQTSGQTDINARLTTDSDYDKAHIEHPHKDRDEDLDPDPGENNNRNEKDII